MLKAKGTGTRRIVYRQLRSGYRRGLLRDWEARRLEDHLQRWPASKVETAYRRLTRPRYRRQALKFWGVLAGIGILILANWWLSSGEAATARETCIIDFYMAEAYQNSAMREIRTKVGEVEWQKIATRTREILERDRLRALVENYAAQVEAGTVVDRCPR